MSLLFKIGALISSPFLVVLAPSTQRETMNLNSRYGLRDKHQMKENGQLQNRPQISHQASSEEDLIFLFMS